MFLKMEFVLASRPRPVILNVMIFKGVRGMFSCSVIITSLEVRRQMIMPVEMALSKAKQEEVTTPLLEPFLQHTWPDKQKGAGLIICWYISVIFQLRNFKFGMNVTCYESIFTMYL